MTAKEFLKQYQTDLPTDWMNEKGDIIIKLLQEFTEQSKYISVIDQHWLYAVEISSTGNRVVKSWNRVSNDYAATECNEFLKAKNKQL